MSDKKKMMTKVIKLEILKPVDEDWKQAGDTLRRVQTSTAQALNHCLREYYIKALPKVEALRESKEKISYNALDLPTSMTKALGEKYGAEMSSYVYGTLDNVSRQRWKTDWFDVLVKGVKSLPSYRRNCPIYIRATGVHIWENQESEYLNRYVSLKLLPGQGQGKKGPENTFALVGKSFDGSRTAVWNRLLSGEYKLGLVQILYSERKRKWFLNLSYSFEILENRELNPETRVGVDLGIATPVCLALNNGFGRAFLSEEGETIRSFRTQLERRRRALRRNERGILERRSGHGRDHKMASIEKLRELEADFRRTANHRLSRAIINFAATNKAGVIVIEDLKGFAEKHAEDKFLRGWTYGELQTMIEQKAVEKGIHVEKVAARYTSQRCSRCGHISADNRTEQAKFKCVTCGLSLHADYNAARNIATPNIGELILATKKGGEEREDQALGQEV